MAAAPLGLFSFLLQALPELTAVAIVALPLAAKHTRDESLTPFLSFPFAICVCPHVFIFAALSLWFLHVQVLELDELRRCCPSSWP
ncbi:hypothetical protein CRG98_043465 [Punica granatum]|uniref:Sodium/calcium exchanger membrane region domain-containing protein n=1 Tax=Punica granatum TaxID=22663 RepID=A0A2I0HWS9_PUNGR|nr:hypothetical protein CRG98_043465 [Punica granatum]